MSNVEVAKDARSKNKAFTDKLTNMIETSHLLRTDSKLEVLSDGYCTEFWHSRPLIGYMDAPVVKQLLLEMNHEHREVRDIVKITFNAFVTPFFSENMPIILAPTSKGFSLRYWYTGHKYAKIVYGFRDKLEKEFTKMRAEVDVTVIPYPSNSL